MHHTSQCTESKCPELHCDRCQIDFPSCETMEPDWQGDGSIPGGLNKIYVPTYKCPECGEECAEVSHVDA